MLIGKAKRFQDIFIVGLYACVEALAIEKPSCNFVSVEHPAFESVYSLSSISTLVLHRNDSKGEPVRQKADS